LRKDFHDCAFLEDRRKMGLKPALKKLSINSFTVINNHDIKKLPKQFGHRKK